MNLRLLCGGMVLLLVSACQALGAPTLLPSTHAPAGRATTSPVSPPPTAPTVTETRTSSCVQLEDTGVEAAADNDGISIAWSYDGQRLAVPDGSMSIWLTPVGQWLTYWTDDYSDPQRPGNAQWVLSTQGGAPQRANRLLGQGGNWMGQHQLLYKDCEGAIGPHRKTTPYHFQRSILQ